MSSILTNTSAMVALQTLQGINKDLAKTQDMISTGKKIVTSKDDAAVWSISKVMGSDVSSFQAISDSLSLSDSTIAVARQASETITDLLTSIKEKIVLAQEQGADRQKIDTDITELREQIAGVVSAAQFNGVNLINGDLTTFEALSSLDRGSDGTVTRATIDVELNETDMTFNTGAALGSAASAGLTTTATVNAGDSAALSATSFQFNVATVGTDAPISGGFAQSTDQLVQASGSEYLEVGDMVTLEVDDVEATYTIREGDTGVNVLGALGAELERKMTDVTFTLEGDPGDEQLRIINETDDDFDYEITFTRGEGGLSGLNGLNVNGTDNERAAALNDIEDMIQYSIDAAAVFGSAQGRIQTQMEFLSGLTDALKTGIGALVDTNMEEASARLQALQVQQQLGVQALSIANQSPQTILALFQ